MASESPFAGPGLHRQCVSFALERLYLDGWVDQPHEAVEEGHVCEDCAPWLWTHLSRFVVEPYQRGWLGGVYHGG